MSSGQFSVLDVLGNASLTDALDPVLLDGFVPTSAEQFVFLNYESVTGIFSSIQNQTFNNGLEHWSVSYTDTNAILTAESGPGTGGVPDGGATFLLLLSSLVVILIYRERMARELA